MGARPVVIAHRGASGYLPEHTLPAKTLAYGMGADYLEQDVIATRDRQLVVLHDLILDDVTDVARRFAGRARSDGHFYCIDFTLAELKTLQVRERRAPGRPERRFAGRFQDGEGTFTVVSLEEEMCLIRGLNRSTGRNVGIYAEIKDPAWHRAQGVDLSAELLAALARFGYSEKTDAVFVQCFDPGELRRVRNELGCTMRLVQLLEGLGSGGSIPDPAQLTEIASYADAIGPSISLLYRGQIQGRPQTSSLVEDAHRVGLAVHPYTFRCDDLPAGFDDFDALLELFLIKLRVDGLFTDFPDRVVRFVADHFAASTAGA